MTLHLLLIDDHALFRAGTSMMLKAHLENVHIAEAASVEQGLLCHEPCLDLVLLDVQLQGINGLEGLGLLKQKWPAARIVILSGNQDAKLLERAKELGADGFIAKSETPARMLQLLAQFLEQDATSPSGTPSKASTPARLLTPRQYEVLELMCQGLSNKMIGRRLNLSENTVRGHVQATFLALQVSSRAEAAFVARRQGLIS